MKNQLYNFIEFLFIIGFLIVGFSTDFIWFLFWTLLAGFFFSLFRTLFILFKRKNFTNYILLCRVISVVVLLLGLFFLWAKILHIRTFFTDFNRNKAVVFLMVYAPILWYAFTIVSEWKELKDIDYNLTEIDDALIK